METLIGDDPYRGGAPHPQTSLGAVEKRDGLTSASTSLQPKPPSDRPHFAPSEVSLYLVYN